MVSKEIKKNFINQLLHAHSVCCKLIKIYNIGFDPLQTRLNEQLNKKSVGNNINSGQRDEDILQNWKGISKQPNR